MASGLESCIVAISAFVVMQPITLQTGSRLLQWLGGKHELPDSHCELRPHNAKSAACESGKVLKNLAGFSRLKRLPKLCEAFSHMHVIT